MSRAFSRWWTAIAVVVVVVLICAQAVPYGHRRVNPPVVMEPAWDSPVTRILAKQACFDCHSNETQWPAYARVAPVSWLIQHDVEDGRGALNFSEWGRPQDAATEAAEEVLKKEMPPGIYRLMHAPARLSDADRDLLARGLTNTFGASHEQENER